MRFSLFLIMLSLSSEAVNHHNCLLVKVHHVSRIAFVFLNLPGLPSRSIDMSSSMTVIAVDVDVDVGVKVDFVKMRRFRGHRSEWKKVRCRLVQIGKEQGKEALASTVR